LTKASIIDSIGGLILKYYTLARGTKEVLAKQYSDE
jgi:hypothetical protein